MAGGTWTAQNKVRPNAYINFKSVPRPDITVGSRGISIVALDLDWGAEDELIEVYSTDFYGSGSLPLIGYNSLNDPSLWLTMMLSGSYLAKVYRKNKGGAKATATSGDLTVTAKYAGVAGNDITIVIEDNNGGYKVTTYFKGSSVGEPQTVATISELVDTDYVSFSGDGVPTISAGIVLAGGTNGTATASGVYGDYLDLAMRSKWQTMAVPESDTAIKSTVATFIKNAREDEGLYVQAVIADIDSDYEGVIVVDDTGTISGVDISLEGFTMYAAGARAGADIGESLTGHVITGMTKIANPKTKSEIDNALLSGKLVLAQNSNGDFEFAQDINSLHTFTQYKNKEFSKNAVLSVLDEIGTTISAKWDTGYKGRVKNNEKGRSAFRGAIVEYLNTLQALEKIDEFAGADDVTVDKGTDTDAVLCEIYVMPVDSMEKLYMTANVTV